MVLFLLGPIATFLIVVAVVLMVLVVADILFVPGEEGRFFTTNLPIHHL